VSSYEELAGYGVKALIDGKRVLAGNGKLLLDQNIKHEALSTPDTIVYIVVEGVLAGYLTIADEPKEDSERAILALKALGIKEIVMLTGDNKETAKKVATELGITQVEAELLPHQKVQKLEEIMARKSGKGKTVFVGDGINDAPVLARSDIGIAMGGVGSDAAIEAADVVIMTDEISKVATALKIARKTHVIVWQNIIFALGVKGAILIMGAFGVATMWEAVFGDVGVALIAVLNATRVLTHK
jgi:Cd2+/Zn2+-exporting ATPase